MGTVFSIFLSPSLRPRQLTELFIRQVFWLPDQVLTLSSHKHAVIVKAIIPGYSGGSTPEFHRIPYYLLIAAPNLSSYTKYCKLSSNINVLFEKHISIHNKFNIKLQ